MTVKEKNIATESRRGPALLAVSGLLGALAASSCCIVPLALLGLGVSGAWIGSLTQLAPYHHCFIVATIALLGTGHWLVYRSRYLACSDGEACAQSLPNWLVKAALIVATILVMAVLGFDLIEPFLFNT